VYEEAEAFCGDGEEGVSVGCEDDFRFQEDEEEEGGEVTGGEGGEED